ncbi:lysozyme inhibitor LprI family protein [Aeromonas cavernicola]|uniref:Lysozyme inhibitor LprI-like N-terminal domain-containing protein n=1 Tax=Aeromonas cavernicola TaxID=1006623 RepID=A0A2H9U7V4_9GAMM|nr:lysozyme inhibitor LprI family protein [Aeromonas cavernicola]PJG60082.1 hypothetical protein CUC53_03865 [Aeromonas cavernicola]
MNLKLIAVVLCVGFSGTASAGFFDSKEEVQPFKCGREDATVALINALRDAALAKVSVAGSELTQFQNKVLTIPVMPSDITTTEQGKNTVRCVASVSATLPTELKELSVKTPDVFSNFIAESRALYKVDTLRWNNVSYALRLADNEKDISVSLDDISNMPMGLAKTAKLAVSADSIIKNNDPTKINAYKNQYEIEDAKLNKIWKAIPASFRSSMKDEQVSWVWSKQEQCGDISRANNTNLSVSERVGIYQCQTAMTVDRIKYLGGYK